MKLTLILLLLITSLMAVVGAFLTTSVTSFYIDSFYQQMSSAFGADRLEFVTDLRSASAQPDGAERLQHRRNLSGRQRRRLYSAQRAVRQPADRPECRGPAGQRRRGR